MRAVFFKSLKVNKTTSSMTFEHNNTRDSNIPIRQMESLAVLLGGYNEYGRKIDIPKHRKRVTKIWDLIAEIENEI